MRKLWKQRSFVPLLVEDTRLQISPENVPIIFEQLYNLRMCSYGTERIS